MASLFHSNVFVCSLIVAVEKYIWVNLSRMVVGDSECHISCLSFKAEPYMRPLGSLLAIMRPGWCQVFPLCNSTQ